MCNLTLHTWKLCIHSSSFCCQLILYHLMDFLFSNCFDNKNPWHFCLQNQPYNNQSCRLSLEIIWFKWYVASETGRLILHLVESPIEMNFQLSSLIYSPIWIMVFRLQEHGFETKSCVQTKKSEWQDNEFFSEGKRRIGKLWVWSHQRYRQQRCIGIHKGGFMGIQWMHD